ncbi:MAG: hypothetical protein K2O01_04125, partial [Bacteroidales bacterium]|nr:hypothetical protein [Bacteroidales bacterium]
MPGEHIYHVEAVYEEGDAMKAPASPVLVVDAGEIFPVQKIGHRLVYNRFASIYWGISSSEMTNGAAAKAIGNPAVGNPASPDRTPAPDGRPYLLDGATATTRPAHAEPTPKSHENPQLDYIANVDMRMYSGYVGIKIGDDYYVASHLDGGIRVLDRHNEVKQVIAPNGLGIVLSMVYLEDRHLLYCGSTSDVKVLDLHHPDHIQMLFKTDSGARHMAYIPELDNGKGGLAVGDHHTCLLYDLEGNKIGSSGLDFSRLHVSGTAYYDGKLYVASQSGPYLNEIHTFDFPTKRPVGEPVQVNEDPALYNLLSLDGLLPSLEKTAYAAGLTICKMDDEAVALGAVFQCAYMTSRLMLLELKAPENVKGYNLYRNGVKINETPLVSRRYHEELTEPGRYVYHITAVSETGKESEPSPANTITVSGRRPCPAPETFTAVESNGMAVLSWMPAASEEALVGFNLYRDEALLGQFWDEKICLSYVDETVQTPESYLYRLESFYASGCLASDTAKLTLTGEGKAMPPFGLQVSAEKQADRMTVTARWETPMFEEPLALRYGNGMPTDQLNIDGFHEYWAAIGWDTANLALYKDLHVVGMEFFIGNSVTDFSGFVILNDQIVYEKNAGRVVPKQWQTLYFDRSFPMDQPDEIAVGYHAAYTATTTGVMVVDAYYSKTNYSDLISLDGTRWSTLKAGGFSGSWSIAALVVHKRDLDAAQTDGLIDYEKLKGRIIRVDAALSGTTVSAKPLATEAPDAAARLSPKAPLTLTGFNVYRRPAEAEANDDAETRLNENLLQSFEFKDTDVKPGEYLYAVSAVYGNGDEVRDEKYIEFLNVRTPGEQLNLSVHPNPATETVYIDGAYETLRIS